MAIPFGILSQALGGQPTQPGILSQGQPLVPFLNSPEFIAQKQAEEGNTPQAWDEQVPEILRDKSPISVPTDVPSLPTGVPDIAAEDRKSASNRKALLALGAGLLGGKNFWDGLSNGITAYQGTLDAEEAANRPKITPLDDGAAILKTNRDGTYTVSETPVAQMKRDVASTMFQGKKDIAEIGIKARSEDKEADRAARKEQWQAQIAAQKEIAEENRQTRLMLAQQAAQSRLDALQAQRSNKPMPPAAMSKYIDLSTYITDAQTSNDQLNSVMSDLQSGNLSLGVANNLRHKAALATGIGANDETVRYSNYQQTIEGLRNTLLMLNKGVQTDGDAERAMSQIIQGNGDSKSVLSNLQRVQSSINRRMVLAQRQMQMMDQQYTGGSLGDVNSGIPTRPTAMASPTPSAPPAFKWRKVSK